MAGENIEIAECLAGWIDANMPEMGGMRRVRVRCCDVLPFSRLPGFLPGVRGITLWSTVYLVKACCPISPENEGLVELLLHELVHIEQFYRAPVLFPVRYLIDLARFGYWNIPAEREARERAAELLRKYQKDRPCQS